MSNELINRVYRLDFGQPGTIGRSFSDLQITFNVKKSTSKSKNKATIKLYNANDKTSGELLRQAGTRIRLFAGYLGRDGLGKPSLIFEGRVGKRGVLVEREPPHIITTLECIDDIPAAGPGTARSRFNWNFGPGTTNRVALQQIIRASGLREGFIAPLPLQTYKTGYTFFGSVEIALDLLTKPAGMSWSIQDGKLQILQRGQTRGTRIAKLTRKTGLLAAPTKTDKGLNVKTLLMPAIEAGGGVLIDSNTIKGIYRVRNLEHSGDFRGGDWMTEFEAQIITRINTGT